MTKVRRNTRCSSKISTVVNVRTEYSSYIMESKVSLLGKHQ